MQLPLGFKWYEYTWHRPFSIDEVIGLLTHHAEFTPRGYLVFEARGYAGQVRYLVGFDPIYSGKMIELFKGHGEIELNEVPAASRRRISLAKHLKVSKPVLSLNTGRAEAVIRAGLAALSAVRTGEEVVVQVVLGSGHAPRELPRNLADPHESWLDIVLYGVRPATAESRASAKEKHGQHMFEVLLRVGACGKGAEGRIDNVVSALRTLNSAGANIRAVPEKPETVNSPVLPGRFFLRLSVSEIACMMMLPVGEDDLPGSPGLHPKLLLPPRWYKPPESAKEDRSYAKSLNASVPKLISISPGDSLEHTILLGPTGSGKSTAMEHLILSDIREGRSVLVLDPKADLVTDILERIPDYRINDVVVIDPSDSNPVGFNPLGLPGDPTLNADAVLAVLREIFSDSWGVRTQQILSAALLTLVETPGASLLWLPALLTDEAFRHKVISGVKDRIGLIPFWKQYDALKESERSANIAPVLNKMQQFIFRPGLRAVLGQAKPKFDLTELFTKRKIVLVPLNRGLVGSENARLLGSLIIGMTWTLALSRARIPAEQRHLVSVYIDELQDYLALPTDLADALAQARGLGVGITMAHQYRGQLPPEIRAGIDANARNKIIFGLNGTDAKEVAHFAPELDPEDFMLLPRYQIYTSIMSNRKNTGWMQGITLPPTKPIRMAAELKALSQKRYGRPTVEVENEFLTLFEEPENSAQAENSANNNDDSQATIGRKERS